MSQHQDNMSKDNRREDIARYDVDPFGRELEPFALSNRIGQAPFAEQQHAVPTSHHVEITAYRHDKHGQVKQLFSPVYEGLLAVAQAWRPRRKLAD